MAIFNKILCKAPGCNYWRTTPVLIKKGPEGERIEIHGCPSCGGEVYSSPKFSLQWYAEGGGKVTRTFDSRAEAEAVQAKFESDKRSKKLFPLLQIAPSVAQTEKKAMGPDGSTPFRVIANRFEAVHTPLKKASERERIAIRHLVNFFEDKPIGEILKGDLMAYQVHRMDQTVLEGKIELTKDGKPFNRKKKPRPVKGTTVTRELTVMRLILGFASDNNYLSTEQKLNKPFKKLPMAKSPEIDHVLNHKQREDLFNALPNSSRPVFEFMLETGCRISEAANLTWKRVENLKTLAKLKDTKTQKAEGGVELLFLSRTALAIIEAQPKLSEYVFTNPKTKTKWRKLNKTLLNAAQKAKINFDDGGLRLQDFRHMFITDCADTEEIGDSTLMLLSRHTDPRSLKRYIHRRRKNAAEKALGALGKHREGMKVQAESAENE